MKEEGQVDLQFFQMIFGALCPSLLHAKPKQRKLLFLENKSDGFRTRHTATAISLRSLVEFFQDGLGDGISPH
jgi:hypothetical protein